MIFITMCNMSEAAEFFDFLFYSFRRVLLSLFLTPVEKCLIFINNDLIRKPFALMALLRLFTLIVPLLVIILNWGHPYSAFIEWMLFPNTCAATSDATLTLWFYKTFVAMLVYFIMHFVTESHLPIAYKQYKLLVQTRHYNNFQQRFHSTLPSRSRTGGLRGELRHYEANYKVLARQKQRKERREFFWTYWFVVTEICVMSDVASNEKYSIDTLVCLQSLFVACVFWAKIFLLLLRLIFKYFKRDAINSDNVIEWSREKPTLYKRGSSGTRAIDRNHTNHSNHVKTSKISSNHSNSQINSLNTSKSSKINSNHLNSSKISNILNESNQLQMRSNASKTDANNEMNANLGASGVIRSAREFSACARINKNVLKNAKEEASIASNDSKSQSNTLKNVSMDSKQMQGSDETVNVLYSYYCAMQSEPPFLFKLFQNVVINNALDGIASLRERNQTSSHPFAPIPSLQNQSLRVLRFANYVNFFRVKCEFFICYLLIDCNVSCCVRGVCNVLSALDARSFSLARHSLALIERIQSQLSQLESKESRHGRHKVGGCWREIATLEAYFLSLGWIVVLLLKCVIIEQAFAPFAPFLAQVLLDTLFFTTRTLWDVLDLIIVCEALGHFVWRWQIFLHYYTSFANSVIWPLLCIFYFVTNLIIAACAAHVMQRLRHGMLLMRLFWRVLVLKFSGLHSFTLVFPSSVGAHVARRHSQMVSLCNKLLPWDEVQVMCVKYVLLERIQSVAGMGADGEAGLLEQRIVEVIVQFGYECVYKRYESNIVTIRDGTGVFIKNGKFVTRPSIASHLVPERVHQIGAWFGEECNEKDVNLGIDTNGIDSNAMDSIGMGGNGMDAMELLDENGEEKSLESLESLESEECIDKIETYSVAFEKIWLSEDNIMHFVERKFEVLMKAHFGTDWERKKDLVNYEFYIA